MTHSLRVSRLGRLTFEAPISKLYAKMIALLGWAIPTHGVHSPAEWPVLLGRIVLTIEDALQENSACHAAWKDLCATSHAIPIDIEITGLGGQPGEETTCPERGGGGGGGASPGGGAGGASGGDGAGGALVIFEYSKDRHLVDVEVFVTQGTSTWVCPKGVELVDVIAIGGGGGGAGGSGSAVAVTSIASNTKP